MVSLYLHDRASDSDEISLVLMYISISWVQKQDRLMISQIELVLVWMNNSYWLSVLINNPH